jgi:hypothetical protein
MAVEFYVEQADRSPQSGVANEVVIPGELVHDDGDGVDVFVFADDNEHVGLARYDAQAFARDYEDDVQARQYDPNVAQRSRVQYQPYEANARLKVRTPEDNGTDPAPSVGHEDVVGVVDAAGGTVSSASEFQGRIVQEGYTDNAGTPTTYNRSNNNFKAIGVAYRPTRPLNRGGTRSDYDDPIRVELFDQIKE